MCLQEMEAAQQAADGGLFRPSSTPLTPRASTAGVAQGVRATEGWGTTTLNSIPPSEGKQHEVGGADKFFIYEVQLSTQLPSFFVCDKCERVRMKEVDTRDSARERG